MLALAFGCAGRTMRYAPSGPYGSIVKLLPSGLVTSMLLALGPSRPTATWRSSDCGQRTPQFAWPGRSQWTWSPWETFSPASGRPLAGTITGGPGRNAAALAPTAGQVSVEIASSARNG